MRAILAIMIILAVGAGCASSPIKRETHTVEPWVLVCDTQEKVQAAYQLYTLYLKPSHEVSGFEVNRTIYVRWFGRDMNGDLKPDFETLGHEVWHMVKGKFHGEGR